MSGLYEALARLNADMDDENEDEFKAQHRALIEGIEPKDIYDYSKADSTEKRTEIAKLMSKDTVSRVKEKRRMSSAVELQKLAGIRSSITAAARARYLAFRRSPRKT